MVNLRGAVVFVGTVVATLLPAGCSDSGKSQCVRSGDAEICYVLESAAAGTFSASGLRPGSTLTVSSPLTGESTYPVNDAGTVDGKVGFINGSGESVELTVSATAGDGKTIVGTIKS